MLRNQSAKRDDKRNKFSLVKYEGSPNSVSNSFTNLTLKNHFLKCTTGCPLIDKMLHGGIQCGNITEIYGESGSGKTQFCLQLSLTSQLPCSRGGLFGGVLFICTERKFPLKRLKQLTSIFHNLNCPDPSETSHSFNSCIPEHYDPCDHVYIEKCDTKEELAFIIDKKLPLNLHHNKGKPIRLVIIDSLASLFRAVDENDSSDVYISRSEEMFSLSSKLRKLAHEWSLAVLITNHAVDVQSNSSATSNSFCQMFRLNRKMSRKEEVIPALGLSWSQCISTRLRISNINEECGNECRERRRMEIVFAPHLPNSSCNLVIESDGLKGVLLSR